MTKAKKRKPLKIEQPPQPHKIDIQKIAKRVISWAVDDGVYADH